MVLYALEHEKELSDRPLRCRVDLFTVVPTHSKSRGETTYPPLRDIFDANREPCQAGSLLAVRWYCLVPRTDAEIEVRGA